MEIVSPYLVPNKRKSTNNCNHKTVQHILRAKEIFFPNVLLMRIRQSYLWPQDDQAFCSLIGCMCL